MTDILMYFHNQSFTYICKTTLMIRIALPVLSKRCNPPHSVAVSPGYGGQGETLISTENLKNYFYFCFKHNLRIAWACE